MLGPKQVIQAQVWTQIIARKLGDETEELHVKEGRTRSRPVKARDEDFDTGVDAMLATAEIFTFKNCVCFSKVNLFSEHLLSPCYLPGIALSVTMQW